MNKLLLIAACCLLLAGPASAQSVGEQTGVNSTLGISPTTPDFVKEAAISDMFFMLQKEVVDRMAAAPGGKEYGRLTVMIAAYAEVEALFDVGPGSFRPKPKVMSAIVRLRPALEPRFAIGSDAVLRTLVTTAFSHRRKTLRNCMKTFLTGEDIEACGLDPQQRPETLAPEQFGLLAVRYCELKDAERQSA